jgi:FtsZ-binding cell division protein ZapB
MTVLAIVAVYTAAIIGGIYYYEGRLNDLKMAIYDYKRALNIKDSASHYTHLQLENAELKKKFNDLALDNDILQKEIKALRKANIEMAGESRDMQYESSTYKSNTYESYMYANQQELELEPTYIQQEPFVRKYGPNFD